jgi:nicotinamide mononucleotide transporter PnuC
MASMTALVSCVHLSKAKIMGRFIVIVHIGFYVAVCWRLGLYGEFGYMLLLYLPISLYAIFEWMRNRRRDAKKGQVAIIRKVTWKELAIVVALQVALGIGFYFALRALGTQMLLASTFSLALAVGASWLEARRSPWGIFGWFLNDIAVLVIFVMVFLTTGASVVMIVMPLMYMILDGYGILEWNRLRGRQGNVDNAN